MKEQIFSRVRILFSVVLFLFIVSTLNAQKQETPYERKVTAIKKQYIKKIMLAQGKWSQRFETELYYANDTYLNTVLAFGLITTPNYAESFKRELKQAEKLKTSIDFKRAADKKAEAIRNKREGEKNKILEQFEQSDAGKIQNEIKENYSKWLSKGEFEKNADYEVRKEKLSKETFFGICNTSIKNRINNISSYDLKIELLPYNSENEYFTISFELYDLYKWQNTLKIPIKEAEKFKNEWNVKWDKNQFDWCLIDNNLYPSKITLTNINNNSQYHFNLPLSNQRNITVSFNGLGLENEYTRNVVFDFSSVSVIEKEQEIKDSSDYTFYNNKIDSVFNTYNREISNKHFNIDKETLSIDNKPIIDKDNPDKKNSFDLAIKELKSTYTKFSEELENTYNRKRDNLYLQYSEYFPDKLKFNSFYDEGESVVIQKVEEIRKKENMYRKYSEYFPNKTEFNELYEQGENIVIQKVESRKKRENMYSQYTEFFPTRSEFDSIYEQGENRVIERVQDQKNLKTIKDNVETIQSMNFSKTDENGIQQMIKNCKDRKIYSEVLKFVLENNKGLSKIWEKEGAYFDNQIEFYESYTSGEYKKILKEKRKKG